MFQSAPPHGERPAWAAGPARSHPCFNPRPRTGSDARCPTWRTHDERFNPRPRTGSDKSRFCSVYRDPVSIRAPARGATRAAGHVRGEEYVSIRAPRTGSDPQRRTPTLCIRGFNPRPRTGSDSWRMQRRSARICFNPRPRTGSDSLNSKQASWWSVFQSAPPHGERHGTLIEDGITKEVSIRAPARGATRAGTSGWLRASGFNPRPRTGSDLVQRQY